MTVHTRGRGRIGSRSRGRAAFATLAVVAGLGVPLAVAMNSSAATGARIDLKVLVVDDGGGMVAALADALTLEGVPHTTVTLSDSGRPTITAAFLADSAEAHYQSVVLPNEAGGGLSAAEMTALHDYEVAFGIRQVDASTWAQPSLGLNWAAAPNGFMGSTDGLTATVTDAGKAEGWGYLDGTVSVSAGSYAYVSTPLSATSNPVMPAGASFTPLVTLPIPGSTQAGSLIGSFTSGGVEQLVVTTNYNAGQLHYRSLAHGIVSWMTRGVHLGYNRNYFTMHFDDAFAPDSRWSTTANCTPGNEDCRAPVPPTPPDIRMTPADVTAVADWAQTNGYQPTLAFNGYYAVTDPATEQPYTSPDPLTTAFVANKNSFAWLNHGYQHLYQGCEQDFTVVPWRCVTTPAGSAPAANGSNITWTSHQAVLSEIQQNITVGQQLGLTFDTKEYLSGEHSGLFFTPQQPVDNPNFASALTAAGITVIGADASREPARRQVGSAMTIPRHPMAIYYNVSTEAEEVDEYNWFYAPPSAGGNCSAPTACMTGALDPATGFDSYIVPTDTAWDLHYILSNDPRPFYAHVSNLTGPDNLGLTLMSSILNTYRASFAQNAPLISLTETQAVDVLGRQQSWAEARDQVSGYLQGNQVTITNPTAVAAPVTAPAGTTVNGAAFGESYGGELSGWASGNQSITLSGTPYSAAGPAISSAATASFPVNQPASFTVTTTGTPVPVITATSALPAGLTLTDNGDGTATIAGTPTATGTTTVNLSATNAIGTGTQNLAVTVGAAPAVTSANSVTGKSGTKMTFTVTTSGFPAPALTMAGALPKGVTFADRGNGTATISGQPASGTGGAYKVTLTATNAFGSGTQAFVFNVQKAPSFLTSSPLPTAVAGTAYSATITTGGAPAPAITRATGTLPAGLTLTDNGDGTATIAGTPAAGSGQAYSFTLSAKNVAGTVNRNYSLTVSEKPAITANNVTLTRGRAATVTVTIIGNPTPSYSVTGTLPTGMRLSKVTGKATISGTPTTAGTYTLTVTATNSAGTTTKSFTITVV